MRLQQRMPTDLYAAMRLPKDQNGLGFAIATANTMAGSVFGLFNYAVKSEVLDRDRFGGPLPATAHVVAITLLCPIPTVCWC